MKLPLRVILWIESKMMFGYAPTILKTAMRNWLLTRQKMYVMADERYREFNSGRRGR